WSTPRCAPPSAASTDGGGRSRSSRSVRGAVAWPPPRGEWAHYTAPRSVGGGRGTGPGDLAEQQHEADGGEGHEAYEAEAVHERHQGGLLLEHAVEQAERLVRRGGAGLGGERGLGARQPLLVRGVVGGEVGDQRGLVGLGPALEQGSDHRDADA